MTHCHSTHSSDIVAPATKCPNKNDPRSARRYREGLRVPLCGGSLYFLVDALLKSSIQSAPQMARDCGMIFRGGNRGSWRCNEPLRNATKSLAERAGAVIESPRVGPARARPRKRKAPAWARELEATKTAGQQRQRQRQRRRQRRQRALPAAARPRDCSSIMRLGR